MQQPVTGPTVGGLVALNSIGMEMISQIELHPERHHPDGTHRDYEFLANVGRETCQANFAAGVGTWTDILLEEVYEAIAETDPVNLRKELVQAAAVIASWIEDIDSREHVTVLPPVADQVAHSMSYGRRA